jgi:hypothetical protein
VATYQTTVTLPNGKKVTGYIKDGRTTLADGSRPPVGSTVQTAGGTFKVTDSGSQKVDETKSKVTKTSSGSSKSSKSSGGSVGIRDYFEGQGYNVYYDQGSGNIRIYDSNTGHSAMLTPGFYNIDRSGKSHTDTETAQRVLDTIASGKYKLPGYGGSTQQPSFSITTPDLEQKLIEQLQAQYEIPEFSFPEYKDPNIKYMSLEQAYKLGKNLYDPNYQMQLMRANEAYSQAVRDLPYYLNVRGQAEGGIREGAEQELSQEHAKALATAGFQHEALLNQVAQQLQDRSRAEAMQLQQQDYQRYLDARNLAYQQYRDLAGDQRYADERTYSRVMDALGYASQKELQEREEKRYQKQYEDAMKQWEKEFQLKELLGLEGLKISQSELELKKAAQRLAEKDAENDWSIKWANLRLQEQAAKEGRKAPTIDWIKINEMAIKLATDDDRVKGAGWFGSSGAKGQEFWNIVDEYKDYLLRELIGGSVIDQIGASGYIGGGSQLHGTPR